MRARLKAVAVAGSLAALWLVAGCLDETLEQAAASGCETDADCAAGESCEAGACVAGSGGSGGVSCTESSECLAEQDCFAGSCRYPIADGAGGVPAELVDGTDECGSSDDCHPGITFGADPDIFWVGGTVEMPLVCTDSWNHCAPGAGCRLATLCAEPPADATIPGLVRCESGDECLSGRCVERNRVKFCYRACATNEDCPGLPGGSPQGPVFECELLPLRGSPDDRRTVRSCEPTQERPDRTLCRNGADCGADRACRFVGAPWLLEAVPVCDAPLPGGGLATGRVCPLEDGGSCAGGGCVESCKPSGNVAQPEGRFCYSPLGATVPRCTEPCARLDVECPERFACVRGTLEERVGTWPHSDLASQLGREIRYCQLPKEGCFDELDCGEDPVGDETFLGWSQDPRRCAVQPSIQGSNVKLFTLCVAPPGGASEPGMPCAVDADCDTNLCVGERCAVPCDPDPARDRCNDDRMRARLTSLGDTTCQDVPGTPERAALRACLPR